MEQATVSRLMELYLTRPASSQLMETLLYRLDSSESYNVRVEAAAFLLAATVGWVGHEGLEFRRTLQKALQTLTV